jgi:hypothetical protein
MPAPDPAPRPRPRRRHPWWESYRAPLTAEERRAAIADPGASWREFFFFEFLRWWVLLGFLVADTVVVVSFLHPLFVPGMVGGLLLALYLEFLAYAMLWRRPDFDREAHHGPFERTWYRPARFGRWTPEGERVRRGLDPNPSSGAPDAREFL